MNYALTRPPARHGIKNIYLFLIFIFLISLDQLSKYLIRSQGGFYICNNNIAFGIKIPEAIFWIFWVAIIGAICFKIFNFPWPGRQFPIFKFLSNKARANNSDCLRHNGLFFILILSGALSNIIDRLRFGCVIDFINLKYWPVFNFADICIFLGAIFLVYSFLKNKTPREL